MASGAPLATPPSLPGGAFFVNLPTISDPRGTLTIMERSDTVPFPVERVFYSYAIPGAATRGRHAHRTLEELIACVAGGFRLLLDDGVRRSVVTLDEPTRALYVPPYVWTSLSDFEPDTVYLVLASALYDEGDYMRDYAAFALEARLRRTS